MTYKLMIQTMQLILSQLIGKIANDGGHGCIVCHHFIGEKKQQFLRLLAKVN